MDNPASLATASHVSKAFLFSGWSSTDCLAVSMHSRIYSYHRGDFIFRKGESAKYIYVILNGNAEIFRDVKDDKRQVLHIAGSQSVLAGAVVLQEHAFYPASAIVISTNARVLAVEREYFANMLLRRQDLVRSLFVTLSQRLLELTDHMAKVNRLSMRGRAAVWILEQPVRHEDSGEKAIVQIPMPKKILSEILGMVPETLSRVLADLAEQGAIRMLRSRKVELLNVSLLQEISKR